MKPHRTILAISDLHGLLPSIPSVDTLIIAGDLTARDTPQEYDKFKRWLGMWDVHDIIIVAGNHDNLLQKTHGEIVTKNEPNIHYLEDSWIELAGKKIYGTPWTPTFDNCHPACRAFMDTEEALDGHFAKIPDDTDILITHSPPWRYGDQTYGSRKHLGSKSLYRRVCRTYIAYRLQLWVWGHIHGGHGRRMGPRQAWHNVAMVDDCYCPGPKKSLFYEYSNECVNVGY